jgi:UDP-N-acetylmuramate dehydrogenase
MNALDDVASALEAQLGELVTRDAPGGAVTTYRCGGSFALAVRVEHDDHLVSVAGALRAADENVPVLVVGRGSNLLVADDGFAGLALVLAGRFDELQVDPDRGVVQAGGAVALPVLARRSAGAGLAGLEFYVGIPGSVGGAVKMNAGGHGAQTDDVIVDATLFDLTASAPASRRVAAAELGLGYRTSGIGATTVVTAATFAGVADDPAACSARIDDIVRWRREHQPGGQNAGSVFTNPPGDAAGRLIEAAGCKGLRIGGAVVSEKHANFFVADANARAADVHALVCEVRRRVADASGVVLEPELRFVGFGPGPEGERHS